VILRLSSCLFVAVACLGFFPAVARSQDSNYWTMAYGTQAQLLGGVVTGSPGDISSVYYNPGALALAPNTEFLFAGGALQYLRVDVTNGSGPSHNLASSTIATVPSLIAGELPILEGSRFAYSYLTRSQVDLLMEKNVTAAGEPDSPLPNATFGAIQLRYQQSVDEGWYGLTWAREVSHALGIGVTPELAVRNQRTSASLFAMGENAAGQQAVLQVDKDFDYTHWRLLARIGMSGVHDSLTYGITLTTPGLGLFGSGGFRQSDNLTDETGAHGNVIGASYQEGLDAHYHSPFGVGVGASDGFGSSRVHAAVEWWNAVPDYIVLEGQPFTIKTPSGDSTVTAVVHQKLDAVFNWGLGWEQHFGKDFAGYASYHTDRSGQPPDSPPSASVTGWNLHHITIGMTLNAWRSTFAVGQSAAFGSRNVPPFVARPDGVPTAALQSQVLVLTTTVGWKVAF
jgi:hypothetical protein